MSVTVVAWLKKIVNWNYLKWLKILLTFLEVSDVSFHFQSVFLRDCLRLISVSQFFRFWIKMRVFNFLMIKVDDRIASGNFRVSRKLISWLKCLCDFRKVIESKFTCHFRFLQIYHSVSKQFQPWCYAQNNLFITFIGNMTF